MMKVSNMGPVSPTLDYKHEIDAAIVRIMKASKTMHVYNHLNIL